MTKDLISNMLSKIKNANLIKHNFVTIPYSKCCFSILKLFLKHGYIKDLEIICKDPKIEEKLIKIEEKQHFLITKKEDKDFEELIEEKIKNLKKLEILTNKLKKNSKQKEIKIFLKYKGWWIRKSLFSVIKRTSTSGQRIFSNYRNFFKKINSLKTFQGIAIISTSSGVMTHIKAEKYKKGGEILCYIE